MSLTQSRLLFFFTLFFLPSLLFSLSFSLFLLMLLIDPYISMTISFALAMILLYILSRALTRVKPSHPSFKYIGEFLLYASGGFMVTVLGSALFLQYRGSLLPWAFFIAAVIIFFISRFYPGPYRAI